MVKTALVSTDLEQGREALDALDRAGINVNVAWWAYLPEYEDWRLVLSSRKFDNVGRSDAYGMLHNSLNAAGIPIQKQPVSLILPMSDSTIKSLRKVFGKAASVDGMRLGGQVFGHRFIEDAFVYRIT
jgi:hypothetical protein